MNVDSYTHQSFLWYWVWHSIKIEIAADRKLFNSEGVSTEDAIKLIEVANAIRVSLLML